MGDPGIRARRDFMGVDFRALLDLFSGQVDRETLTVPIRLTEDLRGYEHVFSGNPRAGIDDEIFDIPFLFVKVKRMELSNVAILCMYGITL
jgi:hypothetical protein